MAAALRLIARAVHGKAAMLPDADAVPAATLALVERFARGPSSSSTTSSSSSSSRRITLAQLLSVARHPTAEALVANAAMLQQELSTRLAERVADMQRLPFIVGCNPHVQTVYKLYLGSLEQIAALPPVQTRDDEARFSTLLGRLVEEHTNVIPILSRGMVESAKYISADSSRQ